MGGDVEGGMRRFVRSKVWIKGRGLVIEGTVAVVDDGLFAMIGEDGARSGSGDTTGSKSALLKLVSSSGRVFIGDMQRCMRQWL